MAPASLVFTWLLVTLRTVTWAGLGLVPEEDGEFSPPQQPQNWFPFRFQAFVGGLISFLVFFDGLLWPE